VKRDNRDQRYLKVQSVSKLLIIRKIEKNTCISKVVKKFVDDPLQPFINFHIKTENSGNSLEKLL